MNRRNLLTAIAAIPLIGRIVPASASPMPQPTHPIAGARDLLIPGLQEARRFGCEAEMIVTKNRLDILVWNERRAAVRTIPESAILDESYKELSRPYMLEMCYEVSLPTDDAATILHGRMALES